MTDVNEKYPIKEEWKQYYFTLEGIRRTGVVNMLGAAPYLQACFPSDLSEEEARQVLCNWIHNYDALNERFGWQK
jgi:type II secretory pathway component PulK